jgi:hypothetical protein
MTKHVHFRPWIGKHYRTGEKCRILVLGESHYGDQHEDRDLTRDLTAEFVRGDWSHRFWTNIGQVISGKPHWETKRAEIWDRIALYNYVQVIAAETARQAPTSAMFRESRPAFLEVLRMLKPTHIVVCGRRLWWEMPPFDGREGAISYQGEKHRWGEYVTGGWNALAMAINHPSSGFSSTRWSPLVRRFLALTPGPK